MAVYHCKICQRTVFSGRRKHVYEKGHRERLAALLKAFGVKVAAARKMIKVASVAKFDAQEHEKMFWCHCCEEEVRTHTSDGGITVLYGSFLEHMFSPAHRKAVNKFWWTQQADVKLKPQFMLSPEEYERYKSSVIKALENYEEKEDVYIKEVAAQIREVEQSRLEILQSVLESVSHHYEDEESAVWSNKEPVQYRDISDLDSEEPGPSDMQPAVYNGIPPVTFIGQQVNSSVGNIHTGATPPWMIPDGQETKEQQEIGPSHADFLKHQEMMKLKKLPANRVGANFDHSSQTDEGWLPSFGRVWNSGRRWQSRHQYRSEAGTGTAKRKRTDV
uniref:Centrosomal AT-AC splicing factor n=1 Tax=Leptobrachium leishanense TaxID=445787 RepID=A0A8C5Q1A6_9ANUR